MDFDHLLNLFDSFWFQRQVLNNHPFPSNPQILQPQIQDPDPLPKESFLIPRLRTRSISEDLSSKLSFMSNSNSPDSVLLSPKLQTIFSSKDIAGAESPETSHKVEIERRPKTEYRRRLRGRRTRRSESRSLSELEFEELKGFMDLGFVFSEEDKGSSLASIVPGLNRLGKREEKGNKEGEEEEEEKEEERKLGGEISRPYLSEAWEAIAEEEEKEELLKRPLMMKWRFPSNQIDMKDNLKWWAHAVASTVR
ncbi:uncharacterized protein LOC105434498 [Cucumis sativus]|uniref:DUF1685 domain-containing protein n=1 Tax=Cucumis sativus TaxID=3659 RepID=A0A0A0LV26_CUCSA|nr:uncharacterized protein LOC105434498 [Cucumis sativus]KGN65608.1 hypothetical protein Csa_019529 [Cucumis sativus]